MAENKTKPGEGSVEKFLSGISDPIRRKDAIRLNQMMTEVTGAEPVMWGDSIVGYGSYHYKYASGREGEWFLTGFSPRKQNLSIYVKGYLEHYQDHLKKLGKHKHGKGCLYINKLEDIDFKNLRELIAYSISAE